VSSIPQIFSASHVTVSSHPQKSVIQRAFTHYQPYNWSMVSGALITHDAVTPRISETFSLRPTMAKKLVDAGCMSISDLHQQKYKAMLKPTMQIGLKYIKHMGEPVTRHQAETALVRILFLRQSCNVTFHTALS
jgi:hypothetical protein